MATLRVFLQMSTLGEPRARRMSMRTSCTTRVWRVLRSLSRSRMMSLTLLSLWLFSSEA